jgi:hypothetical protein
MKRIALVSVALLAALSLSACGSGVTSAAAKVDGHRISPASIQDELKTIADNPDYQAAIEQSFGTKLAGTGEGQFGTGFVAQLLSLRIYYEMLDQDLNRRGQPVTNEELDAATQSLTQQLQSLGEGTAKKFPADYLRRLARQQALESAAFRAVDAAAYFQAHHTEYDETCLSHVLVDQTNRTEAQAKEKADTLRRRIAAGEAFATLAGTESDDQAAAAQAGDLGCGTNSRFDADFAKAADAAVIGQVTAPVQTSFGYHLILVRSRTAAALGPVEDQVRQSALGEFLVKLTCDTKVDIDPQYGTWDRSTCEGGSGLAKVSPPAPPGKGGATK